MKDESSVKRAEFYRIKAAEAREKAKGMKDLEARRTMLEVAAMWEAWRREQTASSQRHSILTSLDACNGGRSCGVIAAGTGFGEGLI